MRKLLFVILAVLFMYPLLALTAGDIAIIAVNTDGTKTLTFVALADIPANTTITFTDNAWNATTEVWRTNEGTIAWSHTSPVAAGTVITLTLGTTFTASLGDVTTNTNFNLSASGDQILAYEGTTLPATNTDSIWLFGFSLENFVWAENSNTSDIPTALTGYSVAMTTSTTEVDNAYFANGNTAQTAVSVTGTKAVLMALFIDSAKYYTNDAGPLAVPTYTITVSGSVTPTIIVSGTLPEFSTYTGTPSGSESYTLSGSNLTGNITVAALTGFQYSTDNSTWSSTLSLPSTYNGGVYVRLSGTTAGSFSGNIVHSSTGASDVNLAATGTVSDPVPTIQVGASFTPFAAITGSPSAAQVYNLDGDFLSSNISVTPPAGYEVSTDGSIYTPTLSVSPEYSGVVYIRLAGTTAGTYNGDVTHTSTGAPQVDLAVSGTVSDPAIPSLLFEENFSYAEGALLTDNDWAQTGTTATNPLMVSSPGLSYTGYIPAAGNAVQTMTTGQDVNHVFISQTSGSVYAAALINVVSSQAAGDYILHMGQTVIGTTYRARVFVKYISDTTFNFGLTFAAGAGASVVYDPTPYQTGTTYLLVVKYVIVDGASNDTALLYVNPVISATEPTPTIVATDTNSDLADIGTVSIRQGAATGGAVARIDGIRVTNNWAKLWDGSQPPTPEILVTGELDPLACIVGSPSEEITQYTLDGTNLQSGITVTAPTHFEVSVNATTGWAQSIVVNDVPTTVYVRMNATEAGTQGGDIIHTSPNAANVNLRVDGEAYSPSVVWNNPESLPQFLTEANTPSAAQSYALSATSALTDLIVTSAAPFELSQAATGPWGYSLTLPSNFNSNVYVRFNPTSAGDFNGQILHNTAEATEDAVLVTGYASLPAGNYATDLFFSEYLEGGSNNKAIEIFNGTGVAVDLSDYRYENWYNGLLTPNLVPLTGTLAHGDVYVMAHGSANASILALADITNSNVNFNGDDALVLRKISTDAIVDIFGRIGEDPGTEWIADGGFSTQNKTLVRKPTVDEGISVNPGAGFPTLATEWDVYAQDTVDYLGTHTFTPGAQIAEAPVLSPEGGLYTSTVNVSMSTTTPGATIYYTTDGSVPDNNSTPYTAPVAISATTTVKAITYATGYTPSSISTQTYMFPTPIADIATLRAQAMGTTVYQLTGEAVLTFQQATRHQKYIQDATAAILIDDAAGVITSTYNLYDGITGITGTLNAYQNLLQFVPVADPGAATSTNNVVVPAVRTLASITSDDQAKLLKVMNVTLDATTVNFPDTAENINATDATATLVMRTFAATDYSGTPIPVDPVDIVCLGGQYNTTMQFSPRFLADITPAGSALEAPIVAISELNGQVTISWADIDGATSYRIETADDPYGTYTEVTTTTNITWTGAASAKKFYRVIAIN